MNELSHESSPYLLQHAQNPVFWKAWKPKILERAKQEDKLVIISSGYSACHWCHVMEHESFEDHEVADVMNEHFISIKIDREERPDIDALYMKAVQLMTGQGGWPLNVVCLPDGRPVWGGTYFRKNQWIDTLTQLAEMYRADREKMIDYAQKLHEGIDSISILESANIKAIPPDAILNKHLEKWKKSFDHEFGGNARAPKFMMPSNLEFLMYAGWLKRDAELLEHVNLTLTRMAWGGLFDTVGGGFSRYSVDMKWHVPHFEKMLYDNAQLVSLYAQAFKLTQNPLFEEVIRKTLTFVERELTSPDGGFFSALDADSLAGGELEEGAFYVWTKYELQKLIGQDFDLFAEVFNINDFGHWENGNYVLIQNRPLEEIAETHRIPTDELQAKKTAWENILFFARDERPRPRLDNKVLTSWNALMITGYADAYKALANDDYLKVATQQLDGLLDRALNADGKLMRTTGKSAIEGFLDDYALTIQALLSLYDATWDEKYLTKAKSITDYVIEHFYDGKAGFFRYASADRDSLISPHYEIEDNVIPASNSVMARNLTSLSFYFGETRYDEISLRMLAHIVSNIDYPSAFSNWLVAFMAYGENARQVAVTGPDADKFKSEIHRSYLPHVTLGGSVAESNLPHLKNRWTKGATQYFICRQNTCGLPMTDANLALKELQNLVG